MLRVPVKEVGHGNDAEQGCQKENPLVVAPQEDHRLVHPDIEGLHPGIQALPHQKKVEIAVVSVRGVQTNAVVSQPREKHKERSLAVEKLRPGRPCELISIRQPGDSKESDKYPYVDHAYSCWDWK